ncbi:DUF2798 domain-containing protein [Lacimicrobium alkaliphilum]|uniref:DUF2798 domain-containing protein n=1 Tax=Lacimicrobium alkaliphilum TaxID=1526571 RepID=A0A0U3ASL3_9ALTE|nr:DUF2798 domain-containing protein [Lacimicrobium alkaliphilum]ALS97055.1 hypothetical protein AT746_01340 [Lacimicrobium alkaliphilum]
MVSPRFKAVLTSFFMSLSMSCIMSLVVTLYNLGLPEGLLYIWVKAWGFGFMVAFPVVLVISPLIRRLVTLLVG